MDEMRRAYEDEIAALERRCGRLERQRDQLSSELGQWRMRAYVAEAMVNGATPGRAVILAWKRWNEEEQAA